MIQSERQGGNIEITKEMIEAGLSVLWDHDFGYEASEDVVRDIYIKMKESEVLTR